MTGIDQTKGGNVYFREDGVVVQGFAGPVVGTYNGNALTMFCVDLFTEIGLAQYTSTPLDPAVWRHEDRAAWLFLDTFPNVTTVARGQALQLAIWDIIHDGGDGVDAGRIRRATGGTNVTPVDVVNFWNAYLTASAGKSSLAVSIYHNVGSNNVPAQALMGGRIPGVPNGPAPVPEPGTWAMLVGGLGLAGLSRRWRAGR